MVNNKQSSSVIDRMVDYGIDRASHALQHWNKSFPSKQKQNALPPYIGEDDYGNYSGSTTNNGNEERLRYRALVTSWIYSDTDLIAKEFSSTGFGIKKQSGEETSEVKNHPFEILLSNPNEEMTGSFLLQYTAWWMELRGKAFWYLAPEKRNKNLIGIRKHDIHIRKINLLSVLLFCCLLQMLPPK